MHHVSEQSLLDLGLMVQMARPDRLKQGRFVQRVCQVTQDRGAPKLRELYLRDREFRLRDVAGEGWPLPPDGMESGELRLRVRRARERISRRTAEGQ